MIVTRDRYRRGAFVVWPGIRCYERAGYEVSVWSSRTGRASTDRRRATANPEGSTQTYEAHDCRVVPPDAEAQLTELDAAIVAARAAREAWLAEHWLEWSLLTEGDVPADAIRDRLTAAEAKAKAAEYERSGKTAESGKNMRGVVEALNSALADRT